MAETGHFIIGTAGHVDHGKTALIRALTGVDTDRLPQEKARGISIELGFASLNLGQNQVAGVVDVPGHEKFIPQMLGGISGIDLVLLIVDANEGVMPQTREHLQIMQLLQVQRGILVLSKCDLVEEDWLDIVEEEVREQVTGTFLEHAPCCRVSALKGLGLEELREEIGRQLKLVKPRDPGGAVRLPIDRRFSVPGFGSVATGTLNSGRVQPGDMLELLPAAITTRVREVQVHGRTVDAAVAGQRAAINLTGVAIDQLPRGSVLGTPGLFRATERLDVKLQLLASAPRAVKFRDPVHFYLGTSRAVARVVLLDRDELKPGEEALLQLVLDQPLLAYRGDRFIVRSYSPMLTIGGGVVIDTEPQKHKRFRPAVLKRLEALAAGDLGFWLQKLDELGVARIRDLMKQTGTGREQLLQGLEILQASGQVELLVEQWLVTERLRSWTQQIPQLVADYLQRNHLRHGMPRATLHSSLCPQLAPKGFELLLQRLRDAGELLLRGELVATPDWQPQPTDAEQQLLQQLEDHFRQQGFQVKNTNETLKQLGLEAIDVDLYFTYLVQEKSLKRLNQESYLHRDSYCQAEALLVELFQQQETLTLAQYRDRLDSGRKLTQALLELFDSYKYTRRVGEERVAWQLPGS
ncbi:MAG TPA: selenocysteine-specific translation elongation factor [Malonomonas sp.]